MVRTGVVVAIVAIGLSLGIPLASAQSRFLDVRYTPTKRAQVAIWIERADGTFLRTLLLTEAVGLRGIGNRPGALQMNSGFRWPYGRREGVLPVWAHRRAAAVGAAAFPRVIFQERVEGYASIQRPDSTRDNYFCLSFDPSAAGDVDATSCASVFNSDKGRYITADDVQAGYAEPYQAVPGTPGTRALSLTSVYPMRRDVGRSASIDSADVATFNSAAREIMPEIDVVTRATAPASTTQLVGFEIPDGWLDDDYVVFVEVNTERDFSAGWTEAMHPTPAALTDAWDSWAADYGYAYRGQPSVVFRIPIHIDAAATVASATVPEGYGDLEGLDGDLSPLDASIANDPTNAPGSGVDRLQLDAGARVTVRTVGCESPPAIPAIPMITATPYDDPKHSHEWATLRFQAVGLPDFTITDYRVKVSTSPIVDDTTFAQAEDAKAATVEFQGLDLCPVDAVTGESRCPAEGTTVEVDLGKLTFQTEYHVAVRAIGPCGVTGPIATTEVETTEIHFTTVAPCFVATAAFGSPMAADVGVLRAFRDRALMPSALGRSFVAAYYDVGPRLADAVREHPSLRSLARAVLRPFVQLARTTRGAR